MNLSLRNRVTISFILANVVILALGMMVFQYLHNLNQEIEKITLEANRLSLLTDEIRISAVSILKHQRRVLANPKSHEQIEKLIGLCEGFSSQLQTLDTFYKSLEVKPVIARMMTYVDSLQVILKKSIDSKSEATGLASIAELADKILESFSEFQDIQYFQSADRDKKIKNIIGRTKKNMMYTLIITFIGTMLLMLVIPGKIALPFKKINDAIRELQDSNFDVSIYYDREDEIGEIASEMNKMISNLKKFEELRADRILLEGRKFDALANMVKKHVLVANANGELIYMNNHLYSLLQCQSEDVIYKNMGDTLIPRTIIDTFNLALKRRTKIENAEIKILQDEEEQVLVSEAPEKEGEEGDKTVENLVFQGYANVIPIRGKESSLDYYLMVLSEGLFV